MNKSLLQSRAKGVGISVLRIIFLLAFEFILLYPIIFMISNSFKVQSDTLNPAVKWFSLSPTLYGYKVAWMAMDYLKSLKNTLIFGVVSALIEVATCAVYAYGLARFKFRLKRVLMFFLVISILIPDVMLIIPRILNFRYMDFLGILGVINNLFHVDLRINLTDTIWTFYLPSLLGVGLKGGLFIYIYMHFYKRLPKELEEAAWIDGAGPFETFMKIIIPSSGVVILTVFIFSFIWHWNDWLLSTMYTQNNHTLAYSLKNVAQSIGQLWSNKLISTNSSLYYGASLAACLMFIFPPMLLYIILQKNFIESIDRVGIVG